MDTVMLEFLSPDGAPLQDAVVMRGMDAAILLANWFGLPELTKARVQLATEEAVEITYPGLIDGFVDEASGRREFKRHYNIASNELCVYRFTPRQGSAFATVKGFAEFQVANYPAVHA